MSKILSIEIDNGYIQIVEASKKINGELVSVNNFLSINIPSDCIKDGKILNIDLIRDEIEKVLLKYRIKTKKAIFLINPNTVITRKMNLPFLKRKSHTMSMIKNEFEQLISTNLNQIIIYKKIDFNKNDLINKSKYIIYGLSYNTFNQYIELSKMLDLKLVALKTTSSCLEIISQKNLTINKIDCSDRTVAFVKISHSYIVFCVIKNGTDDFSRTIYLYSDRHIMHNMDRVAESSENIRFELNSFESDLYANMLLDEISKNIRYYHSMYNDNNIEKIYIYGDGKEIRTEEFEKTLSVFLNVDVESIKEISMPNCNFYVENFNFIEYFNVVLSLFSDSKDMNFMTEEIQSRKVKFYIGSMILLITVCIALMFSTFYKTNLIENESLKNEIKAMEMFINNEQNIEVNNEINGIKNDMDYLEEYKKRSIEVKEIMYNKDNVSSRILREIVNVTPDGTDVTSIVMDENNIQMQCISNHVEEIILFLGNLRDISSVAGVHIPLIEFNVNENYYSYSIVCKLEDVSLDEVE